MSDMNPLCPPLGLPDNESRTHRRSLRERACDVLYVHAIEQVASGGAEHREEHDCPLHQGPEGGKGRTTLRPASCRALPKRTHAMRGNPRPRVAIGLPGSGCGVSRIIGSAGSAATAFLIKAALERVTRSCGRGGTTDHGGPATVCLDDAGEMRMPRGS